MSASKGLTTAAIAIGIIAIALSGFALAALYVPGLRPVPEAPAASKTQNLQVEIFHHDSWARPAGVEAGLPEEKNVVTSYTWRPNGLYVFEGDTVVLKVVNKARTRSHSFVLPGFGLDTGKMAPESEKTLTFVADKVGVFQFACGLAPNPDVDPKECSPDHSYQYGYFIVLERP